MLTSKVYYCRSCCSYLPSVEFQLTTNSHAPGHCRKCVELDNKARHREDHTLYRAMLKSIKHSEEQYKDGSRVIFLLQVSWDIPVCMFSWDIPVCMFSWDIPVCMFSWDNPVCMFSWDIPVCMFSWDNPVCMFSWDNPVCMDFECSDFHLCTYEHPLNHSVHKLSIFVYVAMFA